MQIVSGKRDALTGVFFNSEHFVARNLVDKAKQESISAFCSSATIFNVKLLR